MKGCLEDGMTTLRLEQLYRKLANLRSEEFSIAPEMNSVENVVYEDLLAIEKLLIKELRRRKFEYDHVIRRPNIEEDKIG